LAVFSQKLYAIVEDQQLIKSHELT